MPLPRRALLSTVALLACACGSSSSTGGSGTGGGGSTPADYLPPPAEGTGFQISLVTTAPPGAEIWKCKVSDLPTTTFTAVNHVESVQNAAMHHMDVMTLLFTGVNLDPGDYECTDLYAMYPALMEKGLIIYAAQQPKQEITLPDGTAANLPPALRIMQEVHYVNTTSQPVDVFSKVNIYDYPQEKVNQTIWGGAVRDTNLNIPAQSEHVEWSRCVMNQDVDVLFLTSHTHQLGKSFSIKLFDGTNVGEEIYTNTKWQSPALLSFTDKPLHVAAGTGFEFSCTFQNGSTSDVHWGFKASDEMCQMAMVFTPGESARKCEVVETSDGVLPAP
jgi:hypothetical protein